MSVDYKCIITMGPGRHSGQPCIRGMRITVYDVLEYLAGGMSVEEVLHDFPELTREDILACFAFAAAPQRRESSLIIRNYRSGSYPSGFPPCISPVGAMPDISSSIQRRSSVSRITPAQRRWTIPSSVTKNVTGMPMTP